MHWHVGFHGTRLLGCELFTQTAALFAAVWDLTAFGSQLTCSYVSGANHAATATVTLVGACGHFAE